MISLIRYLILLAAALVFLAGTASGATYRLSKNASIDFELPAGWQVATEAPGFLVALQAEHLEDAMLQKAAAAGITDRQEIARRMLSINELYLFNPRSQANVLIDLSELKSGEEPPSAATIRRSAEYAAEGLKEEDGYRQVETRVDAAQVSGFSYTARVDATFIKYGRSEAFTGIIGFGGRSWGFLYFNDTLQDSHDAAAFKAWLATVKLIFAGGDR